MAIIALIPARAGSKRVQAKNIRLLNGHPLLAYTIAAAMESNIFDQIYVSTDSEEIAVIARQYGAKVPFLRPSEFAGDLSPDIDWLRFTLEALKPKVSPEAFALLRPTSPFRKAETLKRAWDRFQSLGSQIDSLRAVEKCGQHPAKMWKLNGIDRMEPFFPGKHGETPWHSSPYQSLPEVYVQNASLEIAWSRVVTQKNSLAGDLIAPFLTRDLEGFDINNQEDWWLAEKYAAENPSLLPSIVFRKD